MDCGLPKEDKHISTFIDDLGLMSDKGPAEMAAIPSTINAQVDTEILKTFFIPSA